MVELSLHILDIAENGIRARADRITVTVEENRERDTLRLRIEDNGSGMSEEEQGRAMDPFYTTKKVRRVGLGLPLLAEAAERTGGHFHLSSQRGVGTVVDALFGLHHIDRQPMGDVAGSLVTLIAGHPGMDFIYRHRTPRGEYVLDTGALRQALEDVPLNHVDVLQMIRGNIAEGLKEIEAQA
jgi:hypothetical protein